MTNTTRTNKRPDDKTRTADSSDFRNRGHSGASSRETHACCVIGWSDNIGSVAGSVKSPSDVADGMAVSNSETTRQTRTVALADLGLEVPDVSTCEVTLVGDVTDRFELVLERPQLTIVASGAIRCAEIESVYDDDGPVARPTEVPAWVERVADRFGIEEVTL